MAVARVADAAHRVLHPVRRLSPSARVPLALTLQSKAFGDLEASSGRLAAVRVAMRAQEEVISNLEKLLTQVRIQHATRYWSAPTSVEASRP